MKKIYSLLFILSVLFYNQAFSQTGKDGAFTVTAANTVVNSYSSIRPVGGGTGPVTLAAGSSTINHAGATTFEPGDLVMIIQMQGGNGFAMDQTATSASYGAINNYGSAGLYEFRIVATVPNTTSFTTVRPLTNTYESTSNTGPGNNARAQIVKVPRYSSLIINAGASIVPTKWSAGNGRRGGVVAIEVSGTTTIFNGGKIEANDAGFLGGVVHNQSYSDPAGLPSSNSNYAFSSADRANGATKGESIAGSTTYDANFAVTGTLPGGAIFGRGAPANGGGGGNSHNGGGGGGSNASSNTNTYNGRGVMQLRTTSSAENTNDINAWSREIGTRTNEPGGGRGGYSFSYSNQDATLTGPNNSAWAGDYRQIKGGLGGRPLTSTANQRIFMGGGGGAGDSNDGYGTSGGNGGGIVFLLTNTLNGTGTIEANGTAAATTSTAGTAATRGTDAPGGGGGGTIIVKATTANTSVNLTAAGGKGGIQNIVNGPTESEGPGGGGGGGFIGYVGTSTLSVAGGANGTTNSPALTEFPANGATTGNTGQTVPVSTLAMPIATTDIAINQSVPAGPYYAGQEVTFTLTATNTGPAAATEVKVTDILPAGLTFVSSSLASYNPRAGDNTWEIGSLAATNGTATPLIITARVAANPNNTANFYANTATINGYEYDSNSDNNTFTLTLNPVNQPPVITSNDGGATATISLAENISAVTTVTSTGPENSTRTYSIVGGADAGKFDINATSGALTFVSPPDFEAPSDANGDNAYLVTVRVTDTGPGNLTDEQSLTVNVTNAVPANGNINLATNRPTTVSSTENNDNTNFGGANAVDINTISRWSSGRTENEWIYVDLGAVYDINRIVLRWEAAYGKNYQLQFSNDATNWTNFSNGTGTNPTTFNNGIVTNNTTYGTNGTNPINYYVAGSGRYVRMLGTSRGSIYGYSLYEFEVYGIAPNTAPTIISNGAGPTATINVSENTTAAVTTVNAVDDDNNTITYTISGGADANKFTLDPTSRNLVFNSPPDYEATQKTFTVIVRASDNVTATSYDEQTITINVTDVNDAPVAANVVNTATLLNTANATLISPLSGTDPDGNTTISFFRVTSTPNGGVLTINNTALALNTNYPWAQANTLRFDPAINNTADITFNYTIVDNGGATSPAATFTIPINGEPVANDYTNSTTLVNTNANILLDPLPGSDDGTLVTFRFTALTNTSTQGQITVNGVNANITTDYPWSSYNLVRFNPVGANTNDVTFKYTIKDNEGAINATPATFTIPINQQPVARVLTNAETLLNTAAITPLITPLDVSADDGSIVSFRISTLPAPTTEGILYVNNVQVTNIATVFDWSLRNKLSFDPVIGRTADATFSYRIRDNENAESYEAIFTIPINGEPVANDQTNTATLSNRAPVTLLDPLTGTDDGTIASFKIVQLPTTGRLSFTDGTALTPTTVYSWADRNRIQYNPSQSNVADVTFTFTVIDNEGATDATPATFTIPINGEPVPTVFTTATLLNTALSTAIAGLNGTDDGTISTFRFTFLPTNTQGILAVNNGTSVVNAVVNTDYPWAQRNTLTFDPAIGNIADVNFQYTIKDNENNTSGAATYKIPINGEPVANDQTNNVILSNMAGISLLNVLNGTDDISISTFRFGALPTASQGILYVNNAPANTTTAYSWANRNQIAFDPALRNTANVTFTYIIKDNENAEDASPAVFTIPIKGEDQDGDGVADVNDLDDDNDGIPDTLESNGIDPTGDNDNDDIPNYRDSTPGIGIVWLDLNSDGINDNFDKDRDGIINAFDLDSDGDGITDVVEQAPKGIEPTSNYSSSTGRLTSPVNTSGSRIGIPSSSTFAVAEDLNDFDGDKLFNFLDIDSDSDGLRDNLEAQATPTPNQPLRLPSGFDTDRDGIDDAYDATCGCGTNNGTPLYPLITGVMNSNPDYLDENSDDDLYGDAIEAYDNNSDQTKVPGYSLLELKDLAAKFQKAANDAGNSAAVRYYDNTLDNDKDGIPDWLEDDDNDKRLNYLDFNSSFYHDSDNDGWVDLFDQDSYGTMPAVNYAYRSNATQVPLPAELTVFAAKLEPTAVLLNWETVSETSNAYFEVERSQNGIHFQVIGRVKGAGTTTQLSRYSLLDQQPLGGTSYYRLKLVDVKGNFRNSPVIAVKRALISKPQLPAYPNPTTGEFNLELTMPKAEEVQVIITDITGQVIQTKNINAVIGLNKTNFNITDVRTGTYMVIVRGSNTYLVNKLVKF